MFMTVVCAAVSFYSVAVLCGLPWNGDPCFFTSVQKLFQFPMDWGWKTGLGSENLFLFALQLNQGFVEFQCVGNTWNSGKPWKVSCFVC